MITKKVKANSCFNSTYTLVKKSIELNNFYIDTDGSLDKECPDCFQWPDELKNCFNENLIDAEYIKNKRSKVKNIMPHCFDQSTKTEYVQSLGSHPTWFTKLVQIRKSYLQYDTSKVHGEYVNESCLDYFWKPLLKLFESDLNEDLNIKGFSLRINTKSYVDYLACNLSKIFDSLLGEFFNGTKSAYSLSTKNIFKNITLESTLNTQSMNDKITEEIACGFENLLSYYPVFGKKLSLLYLNYLNFFTLFTGRLAKDLNEILRYDPRHENVVINLLPCHSTLGIFLPKSLHIQFFDVSKVDTSTLEDPIEILYIEKNFTAEKFFSLVYSSKGIDKSSEYILPPNYLAKSSYGYVYLANNFNLEDKWPYLLYYLGQITYLYWLLDLDKSTYNDFYYFNGQVILIDEASASLLRPSCIANRSYELLYSRIDDLNKINYKLTEKTVLKTGIIQNSKIVNGESVDLSLLKKICKEILPKLKKDHSLRIYTDFLQVQEKGESHRNHNNLESSSIYKMLFSSFKLGFEDMAKSLTSKKCSHNNNKLVNISNEMRNYSNCFSYYDATEDLRLLMSLHKPSSLKSEENQIKTIEIFHKETISDIENRPDEEPLIGGHMSSLYGSRESRISNNMFSLNEINNVCGHKIYANQYKYSLSDYLIKRLDALDKIYIQMSLDIIAKFFLQLDHSSSRPPSAKFKIYSSHYYFNKNRLKAFAFKSTEVADFCANKLSEYCILTEQNHAFWLANDLINNYLVHPPVSSGLNLYSGKAGIALFLNHYSQINKELPASNINHIKLIANDIRQEFHDHFSKSSIQSMEYSSVPLGICGIGGFLITFKCLGFPELSYNLIESISVDSIKTDRNLDFIAGACGCVGPLLTTSSQKSLDLAYQACIRIKDMQDISGAWDINPSFSKLISFAHGTSGFIAALVRCALTLNTDEFDLAIKRAVDYERKMFNKELLTWPDLRRSYNDTVLSWCHGAPSVLLSRCCLVGTKYWDEYCENEIILGLQAIQKMRFTGEKNICCGNFGLATICSIVEIASSYLSPNAHNKILELIHLNRQKIFNDISSPAGLDFLVNNKDTLMETGLFTGISGIGLSVSSRSLPLLATVISGDLLKLQNLE